MIGSVQDVELAALTTVARAAAKQILKRNSMLATQDIDCWVEEGCMKSEDQEQWKEMWWNESMLLTFTWTSSRLQHRHGSSMASVCRDGLLCYLHGVL